MIYILFDSWNASEKRGLKRLPVIGLLRAKALLFLADALDTLTTLARLVRQVSQAAAFI